MRHSSGLILPRAVLALAVLLAAASPSVAATAPRSPKKEERVPGPPPELAAAQRRLLERCSPQGVLDVSALLGDQAGRQECKLLSFQDNERLAEYAACRDLQGAADGCAVLDGLAGAPGAVAACRKTAASARFLFAALRGGDAVGACRAMFSLDGNSAPSVGDGCAALVRAMRAGDPLAACPEAVRAKLAPSTGECRSYLSFWSGTTSPCARLKDAAARRECLANASLAAGLRDPARCSSAACRALTGDPAACAGPGLDFSRPLCARMAKAVAGTSRIEQRRQDEAARQDAAVKRAEAAGARKAAEAARAKAAAQSRAKPQFQKGQAMQPPKNIEEIMKRLSKGLPAKTKATPPEDQGGDSGADDAR